MADGKRCKRCGYQEAVHAVAWDMKFGIGTFSKKSSKEINEEYPDICKEFIDPDDPDEVEITDELFFKFD